MIANTERRPLQRKSGNSKTAGMCGCVFESPLGWMLLRFRDEKIFDLKFGFPTERATLAAADDVDLVSRDELAMPLQHGIACLLRFADGDFTAVDEITLDLQHLSPFQRNVVEICRSIPAGETIAYGQLAILAGVPGGARAVGNVMRTNRYPLIIPCHRVIGSKGKLCGFTSPQGTSMKQRLLDMERLATGR